MTYVKELSDITLDIDLPDSGIYVFDSVSGEGKSYLCKLLEDVQEPFIKTLSYEKDSRIFELHLNDILNDPTVKLAMLDRADLYITEELLSKVKECSKNKTILIDLKNLNKFNTEVTSVACILFNKERICVF